MESGEKQSRALLIAEAFLKEEAAILAISDLNDFKRSSWFDGKGNPIIRYTQLLGGLEIAPCGMPGISIVVGSDESIINFFADVIPVSTEMRKASSMNTITKEKAVAVVENDLKSQTRVPNLPISYSIKYFSPAAPYIIWHVGVGRGQKSWYYVLNAITGEIVDRRQHAPYGCE